MAVTKNPKGLRVCSHAFGLLKDKEKQEGCHISIEAICTRTGLAKQTVRRFLAPKEDVNGSRLDAAAILADYFGVGLDTLLTIEKEAVAAHKEKGSI